MSGRNVNPKVTYVSHKFYIYFNSFYIFDNILHTIQASDARQKESAKWLLSFFYIF